MIQQSAPPRLAPYHLSDAVKDIIGKRRGWGGACRGGLDPIVRVVGSATKKYWTSNKLGLKWPPMDDRTLNNQPKTGGHNGRWYGGEA